MPVFHMRAALRMATCACTNGKQPAEMQVGFVFPLLRVPSEEELQALLIRMRFDIKANGICQNSKYLIGIYTVLLSSLEDPVGALYVVCRVELFDSVQLIEYL